MRFRYLHESPLTGGGKQCSNILWDMEGRWPMEAGVFPESHPSRMFAAQLAAFTARGYWVNSFPEGDGFTLDPKSKQSKEQVIRDVQECFGWELA
jgi:hypothetical protein